MRVVVIGAGLPGVAGGDLAFAIAPPGGELRRAGTAEFAGPATWLAGGRARAVRAAGHRVLTKPGAQTARHAAGFRTRLQPATPDGSPVIGETRVKGVFVNAGHGPPGWTLVCGGGKLAAVPISGKPPELAPAAFALARFS